MSQSYAENYNDNCGGEPGFYDFENVLVRNLQEDDLESIVRIEKKTTGNGREEYYRNKIGTEINGKGIKMSLVAELDGMLVGFLMGQVFYGEFGIVEPVAIIDSIGVNPDFRRKMVARALMYQMKMNLHGLNIEKIQTLVDWNEFDLLNFFSREGFSPASRLCLELKI